MPNITIYLSDDVAVMAERQAKKSRLSLSRWVATLIARQANTGPRPGVLAAIGAIPEFPSVDELRADYGPDTPRDEMK
jgi:hypothetical protein